MVRPRLMTSAARGRSQRGTLLGIASWSKFAAAPLVIGALRTLHWLRSPAWASIGPSVEWGLTCVI